MSKGLVVCCLILGCFGLQAGAEDFWAERNPLPTGRYGLAAAEIDGEVFVVGGATLHTNIVLAANEKYDPVADEWSSNAPMPIALNSPSVVQAGGKLYVMGGWDGVTWRDTNIEYDPSSDGWVFKTAMPTARSGHSSVSFQGKIFVFGGVLNYHQLDAVEIYDPALDAWTIGTQMPAPKSGHAAAVVADKIVITGGHYFGLGGLSASVEEYDPSTDAWSALPPLPAPRMAHAMAAINQKIFVFGGRNNEFGNDIDTTLEFDLGTGLWLERAPMPGEQSGQAASVAQGRVFVMGGQDDSPPDANWEYIPLQAPAFRCVGFEPPMDLGPVTVRGRARSLPFQAELFDDDDVEMTGGDLMLPPVIQVLFSSTTAPDPKDVSDAALPAGAANEGNQFVFVADEHRWQYTLSLANYSAKGTYTVSIVSGSTDEYRVGPTCEGVFVVE